MLRPHPLAHLRQQLLSKLAGYDWRVASAALCINIKN